MTLTIKDAETDRLARQLAQLTGETINEAVARSVRERLARERRRRGQGIDKQAVMTIVRRIEALPALDDRSAIAKDVMTDLIRDLPETVDEGLLAYGHPRKGEGNDIKTRVPAGEEDTASMIGT